MHSIRALTLAVALLVVGACGETQPVQQGDSSSNPAPARATPVAQGAQSACLTSTPAAGAQPVAVFFHCGERLPALPQPLARSIPDSTSRLRGALQALLAGPTDAEQAAGFDSPFSAATAGLLISATVDAQGLAVVNLRDFHQRVPNVTTSAGMQVWQSQLDATVFQFPEVLSVDYQIEGDCLAYWRPFQTAACQSTTREDWERRTALWQNSSQ